MSARYWVLCSDELMASDARWADAGLHPLEPATALPPSPGMRWWLFEDDNAPEALNGKRVELTVETRHGEPVIVTRRPVP